MNASSIAYMRNSKTVLPSFPVYTLWWFDGPRPNTAITWCRRLCGNSS